MGVKGRWARLFVGGSDMSSKTISADLGLAVSMEDTTAWQDAAKTSVATGTDSTLTLNGYLDTLTANAGGMDEALATAFAAATPAAVGVLLHEASGAEAGMPVYVFPAPAMSGINVQSPATGLHTIDGDMSGGSEGWRRGVLLWYGAVTATGTKTAIDIGAAGAAGGDLYLWVVSITGTATNAALEVASAATQAGTYSAEGTFTFSAVGSYAAAMTGAVSRWLRPNLTSLGGATSITFAVVGCVDGVTQPA